MNKMVLTAYSAATFNESDILKDDEDILKYEVVTNPENLDRTLTAKLPDPKKGKETDSEMKFAGFEPEKYSFDLVLDGTGIINPARKDVAAEIKKFLRVVYSSKENSEQQNYVMINFCGDKFQCKLSSLSIKYTLFNPDGSPLRAKLSCSFISAKESENKPDGKKITKGKPDPAKKRPEEPSCRMQCIMVCDSFQETIKTAKENGSSSLFNPNDHMCSADRQQNYSSEPNQSIMY